VSLPEIYKRNVRAIARVTVKTPEGDYSNGAAFHVGGGFFITARHVVHGNTFEELAPEAICRKPTEVTEIYLPSDPNDDVALLKTTFEPYESHDREGSDVVEIGGHLDDWISDAFMLWDVVLFGYPRIPLTHGVELVCVSGQVNAIVDRMPKRYLRFIISSVPRGGFSGGPVMTEGFLLGVCSEALVHSSQYLETGFTSVVSIEPIWSLLQEHRIALPGPNGAFQREVSVLNPFSSDKE